MGKDYYTGSGAKANMKNLKEGQGENSIEQTSNQSLGTNSAAFGEGTIAAGKWSFAEGRGNNFDVTCVNGTTANFVIVNGDKADEIRKNAVIFCNDTFRYVTGVANNYVNIPVQETPPLFEQNKYYDLEGTTYVLLTSEPSNWEYYYTLYYYINGYNLNLDDYLTYAEGDTVNVFMGAALASASHTEGNFCNTVYLGATTLTDEDEVQRNSAEGSRTLATGYASKAIGEYTRAIGKRSFAQGYNSVATGDDSVALNHYTQANAKFSTAMGDTTLANCQGGLAVGRYNQGSSNALFEVGNGTTSSRHTALEVNTNGKTYSYTTVADNDADATVVNKAYVDSKIPSNIINNLQDGAGTNSIKQALTASPFENQASFGKYNYIYTTVVSTFTLDTAKTGGQMLLRIGQYSGGTGAQNTTYTFYNPKLINITTGQVFDITLSSSTISGYNSSVNKKWNLRGGSSSDMQQVTVQGQTGIKIRADLGWRYAEYRYDSLTLPAGTYEITVDSPTINTISHLTTANVWYQNSKIDSTLSYRNDLLVVGYGASGSEKNAFEVREDGTATVEKQGYEAKSIVQKQYVDTKVPAPPSSDGTYTLQCTVSSGAATYSWV